MLFPDGRSVYSGVLVKLVTRLDNPVRWVKTANLQVSYTLSRFVSQAQDEDSINLATDNDNPTRFTGPERPGPETPDLVWWHFRSAVLHEAEHGRTFL